MSTMSLLAMDHSERLAKRFASQASAFLDSPIDAQSEAAKIPLENLFRLLQMYRYDAFLDEPRSGVLEFRPLCDQRETPTLDREWHRPIAAVIARALQETFQNSTVENAVIELQAALSWLATNEHEPPIDSRTRAKAFFEKIATAL